MIDNNTNYYRKRRERFSETKFRLRHAKCISHCISPINPLFQTNPSPKEKKVTDFWGFKKAEPSSTNLALAYAGQSHSIWRLNFSNTPHLLQLGLLLRPKDADNNWEYRAQRVSVSLTQLLVYLNLWCRQLSPHSANPREVPLTAYIRLCFSSQMLVPRPISAATSVQSFPCPNSRKHRPPTPATNSAFDPALTSWSAASLSLMPE